MAGLVAVSGIAWAGEAPVVPRFELPRSGLALEQPARAGRFFAVAGRRAAAFGYENRGLEAWVYPLTILDELRLSFRIEGYPLELEGSEILASVSARPEATTSCTPTPPSPCARLSSHPRRARHRDAPRRRLALPMTAWARFGPGSGPCGPPGS
jgi:hypothetical protein